MEVEAEDREFKVSFGYTERTYLKNRKKNKNNGRKATIWLFAISHAQKRILGYSEFTGVIKEGLRLLRPFKIASVRGSLLSTSLVLVALFLIRSATPLSGHSKATGPPQSF